MKERFNRWAEKHDLKTKYKKYIVIAYVVIVMVPVMLSIGLADRGTDDLLAKMIANVLLLLLFVTFFVFDYRKKLAQDWGLVTMKVESEYLKELSESLSVANEVKLVVSDSFDGFCNVLESAQLGEGCKVDILMINPFCEYAGYVDGDVSVCADRLEAFAAKSKAEVNIKYYSHPPIDSFALIDSRLVYIYPMTQRLKDGRRMVKSYIGNKKGTRLYVDIFNRYWTRPVKEDDAQ